ncbi:hypothetical protein ACQEU8_03945 [Streptomyces sp. CA-250714]|uniref:hypothetical protein n=1 Tax=Streptomyces sp. CA-250714 TaxID=3240060 RepID=UPI003D945F2D
MPNLDIDDGVLSYAYLQWLNQAPEERMGTLPNDDVEIYVDATPSFPAQPVRLGATLHSFLHPANPGAGKETATTLEYSGIPVHDLEGLGRHIHPRALNPDQLTKWATPEDIADADDIYKLFNEGRATRGYLPPKINPSSVENRRNPEPGWAVYIRSRLHHSRQNRISLGPAGAWALIDNDIPIQYSQEKHHLKISSSVLLESEKAARERGEEHGRNIRALYDWGVVPREHVPGSALAGGDDVPEWARRTLARLHYLAKADGSAAASEEPEIAALREAGRLTLVPSKSGNGLRISQENKKTCTSAEIRAGLGQLSPEVREFGPGIAQQDNPLGAAESARQPGASYGQPGAQHALPFQPSPEVPTWAGAGAFAPPTVGGYQPPSSSAAPAHAHSLAPGQQRPPAPQGQRRR